MIEADGLFLAGPRVGGMEAERSVGGKNEGFLIINVDVDIRLLPLATLRYAGGVGGGLMYLTKSTRSSSPAATVMGIR